jgi:lipopolysaccharide transport protein LptA
MIRRLFLVIALLISAAAQINAQSSATPAQPAQKAESGEKKPGVNGAGATGPITTEIYADEASFDSAKNIGIFTGHVKVNDPRFNIQSDKLTVYIHKGEDQGLEKAVAEGNVGVVRERAEPSGPPQRSIGRSDMAVYIAKTEDVELTGNPRVQQGLNTHVATSPSTVMILNQNGQLVTHGPSRTEIRQEAKKETAKQ